MPRPRDLSDIINSSGLQVPDGGTIGTATTGAAITLASDGTITTANDIVLPDSGYIGSSTSPAGLRFDADGTLTVETDIFMREQGAGTNTYRLAVVDSNGSFLIGDHTIPFKARGTDLWLYDGTNDRQVAQSGSNANGGWMRFYNGIQICWSIEATAYGTSFAWTYPAAFNGQPNVTAIGSSNDSTNFRTIKYRADLISNTSCNFYASNDTSFTTIAIGGWS